MLNHLKQHKLEIGLSSLLLLTFVLYFKSIFFQYAWDDVIILDNDLVHNGLKKINQLFIKKEFILLKNNFGFRPITLLSFKLEFLFFGTNAKISHFFNLFIYLINILLMFFIINKEKKTEKKLLFFIGLSIFSFHTLHVEVVSNVKSRDELLGLFFSLLGIIFIINGIKKGEFLRYFYALLFFTLAILSKEIEAVLILITTIGLIYFYPTKRKSVYIFSSFSFLIISIVFPYALTLKILLFITQFIFVILLDFILNKITFKQDLKLFVSKLTNLFTKDYLVVSFLLISTTITLLLNQNNQINYCFLSIFALSNYRKNKIYLLSLIIITTLLILQDLNKTPIYILLNILPFFINGNTRLKKHLSSYFLALSLLFISLSFIDFELSSLITALILGTYAISLLKEIRINPLFSSLSIILTSGIFLIYSNYLGIFSIINTFPALEQTEVFKDIVKEDNILGNQFIHLNLIELIPNSLNILMVYLENFFYPINLKYYYGYNQIQLIGYDSFRFYISLTIHLFLIFLSFYYRKKDSVISFLSLSYLISISIYSHLIIKLPDTMADRFFFIPSIFLSFLIVLLIQKIKLPIIIKKYTLTTIFSFSIIILFILSFQRQDVWESNKTLFSSDITKLENCSRCHYNLALELSKEYEQTKNINLKENIVFHFKKAIEIFPNAYNARIKLAIMYNMFSEPKNAISILNEVTTLYKEASEPYFEKGKILFESKNYIESFKNIDLAIQLFDNNPNYYYYQAWAAFNINSLDNAIQIAEFAKIKFPQNYMFPDALYEFYLVRNEKEKAINELKGYLKKDPTNKIILNKLKNKL